MPTKRLTNKYWTATGSNGRDDPLNVGIFDSRRDAEMWSRRQNETQHQQEWGRGSAGPMTWKARPLYTGGGALNPPDPSQVILPERQWESEADGRASDE